MTQLVGRRQRRAGEGQGVKLETYQVLNSLESRQASQQRYATKSAHLHGPQQSKLNEAVTTDHTFKIPKVIINVKH